MSLWLQQTKLHAPWVELKVKLTKTARHLGLLVAVVNYVWFVATTVPRFVLASVQTAIALWRASSKTYPPAAVLENIR